MVPAEPLLQVTVDPGGAVVLAGEIDLANFDELATRIRTEVDASQRQFVVDLAGIEFMDSSGLRLLLETKRMCAERGVPFLIRDPSHAVRRLLDMTGLTDEMNIT